MAYIFLGLLIFSIVEVLRQFRRGLIYQWLKDWQMAVIWCSGIAISILMVLYGCYQMDLLQDWLMDLIKKLSRVV